MKQKKLLFFVNDASFLISHRLPVLKAARSEGFEVHVLAASTPDEEQIKKCDFRFHEVPLVRGSTNPLYEIRCLLMVCFLFQKIKPDLAHLVTIKAVLYGGIAARLTKTPGLVIAVAGLGHLFTSRNMMFKFLKKFVVALIRFICRHPNLTIIFQNESDRAVFVGNRMADPRTMTLIKGSGVDLLEYRERPETEGPLRVVMASRLLKEKGVFEFVEAARAIRQTHPTVVFQLVGAPDPHNPSSVSREDLLTWHEEGCVEWLGYRSDVSKILGESHLFVFPSYYGEGLPKCLIEASASGRAIVTTTTPGCSDAVIDGLSGYLVPPRDQKALNSAILDLIEDGEKRREFGACARRHAEENFSISEVVAKHMEIYQNKVMPYD